MAELSAQQPVNVEKGRTAERLGCVESEGTGLDMRSWADQIVVTGFGAMMARSRLARTCTARQPMDSPISDRSSIHVHVYELKFVKYWKEFCKRYKFCNVRFAKLSGFARTRVLGAHCVQALCASSSACGCDELALEGRQGIWLCDELALTERQGLGART